MEFCIVSIVNGQSPGNGRTLDFFLNEPLQKRPVITIQDSGFRSDGRFECHLSWERTVQMIQQRVT